MVRYLISLIFFFVGINFLIYCSGGNILTYIDIPNIITIVIIPFILVSILYGFKNMKTAFSIALKKEADNNELKKAFNFFNLYGKIIWIVGITGVIIGIIETFINLEKKNQLGPNLALAITSIYYCCITYAVIIIPFTIFIKKKLKE